MKKTKSFTMAEILLSLAVIGIIAAMTLPSLVANINEKTWASQRKALYNRMTQALSMLPSLNGYGIGATQAETEQNAAQTFVTDGLSKVLNINNICSISANASSEIARKELKKCGIPDKITTMINSKMDFPTNLSELNLKLTTIPKTWGYGSKININTVATGLELKNGESVAVFYNPYCKDKANAVLDYVSKLVMCANFVFDLNGSKGPNKVGKDIGFMTAIYPYEPELVMPQVLSKNTRLVGVTEINSACTRLDKTSRAPNIYELHSIFYNMQLIGMDEEYYWASSIPPNKKNAKYLFRFDNSVVGSGSSPQTHPVRCVKR